jgi:hypothetical protein
MKDMRVRFQVALSYDQIEKDTLEVIVWLDETQFNVSRYRVFIA